MNRNAATYVVFLGLAASPLAAQDTERLYQDACDRGDLTACDVLGLMFMAGDGVFQDLERAVALFRRACEGGEAVGCGHLGLMYHTGAGVALDVAAAVGFYRRACELGERSACENLETMELPAADAVQADRYVRSGRVVDAETRRPLDGTIVHVPELGIRVTTGASGRVELGRLPSGNHRITAERAGYEILEGELPVPSDAEFLLLLNRASVDDLDAQGRVLGRVMDDAGGAGLSGVAVTVSGATRAGTLTDRQGRFELRDMEPGVTELEFTRLGYAPRSTTLIVQPGRTVEVAAAMSTQPIELEPIEVMVRSGYLERNGFYRRARDLRGRTFTRDELDTIDPMYVSDLFWRIPGVSIRQDQDGVRAVSRRGTSFTRGPCTLRVYVDGMPMLGWDMDQLPPDWLEAAEVYQGPSTPIQYSSGLNSCGVILLWTRRGG